MDNEEVVEERNRKGKIGKMKDYIILFPVPNALAQRSIFNIQYSISMLNGLHIPQPHEDSANDKLERIKQFIVERCCPKCRHDLFIGMRFVHCSRPFSYAVLTSSRSSSNAASAMTTRNPCAGSSLVRFLWT